MIREVLAARLFLGNAQDARDLRLLNANRIAAVVDVAVNEPPAMLAREMIYVRIPMLDGDGCGASAMELAIHCIVKLLEIDVRTMVACSAAMSRSPAIASAAIAVVTHRPLDECLRELTAGAPHDVSAALWSRVTGVFNNVVTKYRVAVDDAVRDAPGEEHGCSDDDVDGSRF
jgi:hypothetical protein